MSFQRSCGILLHPTSLPGRFGIGDLGPEAYQFVDFLAAAGQHIWQVLPLGPTGYGDSPYQCFSAFAGNPVLVSPDKLHDIGLLDGADLAHVPQFPAKTVDFANANKLKAQLLKRAFVHFCQSTTGTLEQEFEQFKSAHDNWLDDYALFAALKQAHGGEAVWTRWEPGARSRDPRSLQQWRDQLRDEIETRKFWQFLFFRQWAELKQYAHEHGIKIMGDMPIYVAHDSADVWAHSELFCLDAAGEPEKVAGVPPDYFSATGQLWGNPIYRWEEHARTGYAWWIERFRSTFDLIDICRVDHFRGFAGYWEIPAGSATAINGRWVKGPGAALFEAVENRLGSLPIVAENLGVITEEVDSLRERFGFPGMAILQFAFGKDPQAPDFKPHNYPRNRVAYTGTHDNDTAVGWWNSTGAGDSTRTAEDVRKEHDFARQYLGLDGQEINWVLIRTVLASVADIAMYPLQDVLGLGSEARMNLPGTASGNWGWRFTTDTLQPGLAARLKQLAVAYDRT